MSGQTVRWGMAFAATTALSASLLLSAAKAAKLTISSKLLRMAELASTEGHGP